MYKIISEPFYWKTKGTTMFLPTLEQGSQITCPIHPLAWPWVHEGKLGISSSTVSSSNSSLLLDTHSAISVDNNKYSVVLSSILGSVLPPYICYLSKQFFFLGIFPSLGNFRSSLNPWFAGASNGQIPDFPLVIITLVVVPTCSPLMESWLVDFNMVVSFVPLQ